MATYVTLYSVEAGVEPAVVTVVTAELTAITGLQVVRSRQLVNKVTPRVEVLLTVGEQTGSKRLVSATDTPAHEWLGTLDFKVVTDRNKQTVHDAILGRLRVLALYDQSKFSATPTDHVIAIMRDAGTSHSVSVDADEQETTLSFAVKIAIRASSWP